VATGRDELVAAEGHDELNLLVAAKGQVAASEAIWFC
jgi:hypothetical protein